MPRQLYWSTWWTHITSWTLCYEWLEICHQLVCVSHPWLWPVIELGRCCLFCSCWPGWVPLAPLPPAERCTHKPPSLPLKRAQKDEWEWVGWIQIQRDTKTTQNVMENKKMGKRKRLSDQDKTGRLKSSQRNNHLTAKCLQLLLEYKLYTQIRLTY